MDKKEHWEWNTFEDLERNRRLLNREGRKIYYLVLEASDKRNPFIPQLAMVRKEIKKTSKDLEWAVLAHEKRKEWYQKDQHSRLTTGKEIPLPEWLKRYDINSDIRLSQKLEELRKQEWNLEGAISDFRYTDNYDYNHGGN